VLCRVRLWFVEVLVQDLMENDQFCYDLEQFGEFDFVLVVHREFIG